MREMINDAGAIREERVGPALSVRHVSWASGRWSLVYGCWQIAPRKTAKCQYCAPGQLNCVGPSKARAPNRRTTPPSAIQLAYAAMETSPGTPCDRLIRLSPGAA